MSPVWWAGRVVSSLEFCSLGGGLIPGPNIWVMNVSPNLDGDLSPDTRFDSMSEFWAQNSLLGHGIKKRTWI